VEKQKHDEASKKRKKGKVKDTKMDYNVGKWESEGIRGTALGPHGPAKNE